MSRIVTATDTIPDFTAFRANTIRRTIQDFLIRDMTIREICRSTTTIDTKFLKIDTIRNIVITNGKVLFRDMFLIIGEL